MITTFTRVPVEDIDSLIHDEELVTSLVTELGFDSTVLQQLAGNAESANPETLFQTLESRWNGYGQVFSLEDQIGLLTETVKNSEQYSSSVLASLDKAGRAIPVMVDGHHVRIFFPNHVDTINEALISLPIEILQAQAEKLQQASTLSMQQTELISAPLWQLYDGLCTFFQNAHDADEYILMARQKV